MIVITIDYNDDTISIVKDKSELHFTKVKNINQFQDIIYEIINLIEPTDVTLDSLNEETYKVIGMW